MSAIFAAARPLLLVSVCLSPFSVSLPVCLSFSVSHTHSLFLARCCAHTPAHTKARASEWARGWERTRETRGGGDKGIKKENLAWLREWLKLPCSHVFNLCRSSGATHTVRVVLLYAVTGGGERRERGGDHVEVSKLQGAGHAHYSKLQWLWKPRSNDCAPVFPLKNVLVEQNLSLLGWQFSHQSKNIVCTVPDLYSVHTKSAYIMQLQL